MQKILGLEISNKVSGYMLLYTYQLISYKDMTSTVLYSGKCLLRKNSLLQVSTGFPLMGWPVYTFHMFCFQLYQKPVQTRYGTEIVTNTVIAKTRNNHRRLMTEEYRKKGDKCSCTSWVFFHWLFLFLSFL